MRCLLLIALGATSCTSYEDVVGPFTGEARRYVVDSIHLPRTSAQADAFGDDLSGDGISDNQLGKVIATLTAQGNVTGHGDDMIAAGVIASSLVITADDFVDDPTVSVLYLGADGDTGVAVGGTLRDGTFRSNPTRETRVPGSASIALPVFIDADPSTLPLIGMEIHLFADGNGGFDAVIRGGVPHPAAVAEAARGIQQMVTSFPSDHIGLMGIFDTPPVDWKLTTEEITTNSLLGALLSPDVVLDGRETLSFAFRAHLSPCPSGRCADAPPEDLCRDRILDGNETDVDCGGSCRACVAGSACTVAADCETGACDGGTCGPPSCTNGKRDAFEIDVDCGSYCKTTCATGRRCFSDGDCATGQCGPPPPPCDPEALFCFDFPSYSTCQ